MKGPGPFGLSYLRPRGTSSPVVCRALWLGGALLLAGPPGMRADQTLGIARSGASFVLTWTNLGATLQQSLTVTGVWSDVTGAVSPYPVPPINHTSFYRTRQAVTPPNFEFRYVAPTFTTLIGDPASSCGCASPENPNGTAMGGNAQDNAMGNVFLHTGELAQHAVDLTIAGRGFDWRFERHYRSGMNYDGPLGYGWEFNYNRRLVMQTNGDVLRMDGAGRADRYVLTNGNYQAPSGFYTRLATNNDGSFTERDRHGMGWFYAPTNALGIAQMTAMTDRNSNQMIFQYNGLGQLTNVIDTLSRSNAYNYDGNGRLSTLVDFTGRMVQFGYDANGNLIWETSPSVSGTPNGNDFPLGKKTAYTYSAGFPDARFNHNLLTVTAPNEVAAGGPPRLVAQYNTNSASLDADRLVSLQLGGTNASGVAAGGTLYFTYAGLGAADPTNFTTPVFQTTVTNRNGNVSQYQFNQLGNIVCTVQFTRGIRPSDPASFTSTFAYNKDGEMLARTNAEGDMVLYTYDFANSDRFQQGNLLQTLGLPGPRGGDQTNGILVTNSYEPNFNLIATATDGRGNTTKYAYDQNGNRTNIIHRISSIVEDFEYNAYGQMTAHVLPDNGSGHHRRDVMTYYSSPPQTGYLQNQIVDFGPTNFNLTTTYEYDARGNVTHTIDPRGNDSFTMVNALDQVVRSISRLAPAGVRYTNDTFFDANSKVVRTVVDNRNQNGVQDPVMPGVQTLAFYDILDYIITNLQQVAAGHYITSATAYDANQNRVLSFSPEAVAGRQPNNVVQTIYDERDLAFQRIRAPGDPAHSTLQYDYDGNGNVVRTMQGLEDTPRTTLYAYDGFNRRVATIDATGNTTTNRYDPNSTTTNSFTIGLTPAGDIDLLASTSYTHDAMDRLLMTDRDWFDAQAFSSFGSGHAITTTEYSDNSQVTATYDANTNLTTILYDTANRRSSVIDANYNSVTYFHDANDNVIRTAELEVSDLGSPSEIFYTTNVYDSLDRLIAAVDNIGNTNRFAYDSRNNRVLLTDARGNLTTNVYDGLNRFLSMIRCLTSTGDGSGTNTGSITTSQQYDDDSRLIGQIDDNLNATRYAYDALNRRIVTRMADGNFYRIGTGTVTWPADTSTPNLAGFTNGYDVHDNVITILDANSNLVRSTYDLLNRTIFKAIISGPGVIAATTAEGFDYDGLSRLVFATNNQSSVERTYDSLGRVLSETQILHGAPGANNTVFSDYDPAGNQLTNQYPGGRVIVREYDSLNRAVKVLEGTNQVASYFYIGPARVERRSYGNGTFSLYAYDGARRMTNVIHYHVAGDITNGFESHTFDWDPSYNKTLHSYSRDGFPDVVRSFTNDSVDRLIRSAAPWGTSLYSLDGVDNRTDGYTFNALNEYNTTPFGTNTFDSNGNLASVSGTTGTTNCSYDYRDLMVGGRISGGSQVFLYAYDVLGRRVAKYDGPVITRFLYDGWQELEEQTNGVTLATYVYGDYIDEALTMRRSGTNYYYHSDDLYNVTALTDSGGQVAENYDYGDYGEPLDPTSEQPVIGDPSAVGNPLLFAGRRYDDKTGWYYLRTRFLDCAAGRFTSRDALGYLDSLNLYSYVNSKPGSATDPFGMKSKRTSPRRVVATFTSDKWEKAFYLGHLPGPGNLHALIGIDETGTNAVPALVKRVKGALREDECISRLIIAGHGYAGGWGNDRLSLAEITEKGNSNYYLRAELAKLAPLFCPENEGVILKMCSVAKDEEGKAFIKELAEVFGTSVTAWDDWYESLPTGGEYQAKPGGTVSLVRHTGRISVKNTVEAQISAIDSIRAPGPPMVAAAIESQLSGVRLAAKGAVYLGGLKTYGERAAGWAGLSLWNGVFGDPTAP